MRPSKRNQLGMILVPRSLPDIGKGVLRAPTARRLDGLQVVVQVRPAAAASFLAKHADLLSFAHAGTQGRRRHDRLHVEIAVNPAAVVKNEEGIILRLEGRIATELRIDLFAPAD